MHTNRCGHFTLEVEELRVPNSAVPLRVPVRRCALAEYMISVLARSEEGLVITRQLVMTPNKTLPHNAGTFSTADVRVAFGPDLEAIHGLECTVQRCQESCTPSYRLLLQQFGFHADAERENGEGCQDLSQAETDAIIVTNGDH